MRVVLFRLLAVLGATLVALIALESVLRWTSTTLVDENSPWLGAIAEHDAEVLIRQTPKGKRLQPNARVTIRRHRLSHRDILIETNSLGLRDAELGPREADELRLLVIGDSITWADYLPADETYVEQIEQRLRAELTPRRVEVVNAGVGDIGLREEVELLSEIVRAVAPEIVVVGFYLNDSRPPWGFPGEMGSRGWLRRHSVLAETLYRQVRLRRWVAEQGQDRFAWIPELERLDWRHERASLRKLAHLARYDWGAAWQPDSWRVIGREFQRLRELSVRHHFEVLVVAFPVAFQVYSRFLDDEPQRRLRKTAAAHGFGVLDLLPVLRQRRGEELFFDQCHPRAPANALIGQTIADHLIRSGLVSR